MTRRGEITTGSNPGFPAGRKLGAGAAALVALAALVAVAALAGLAALVTWRVSSRGHQDPERIRDEARQYLAAGRYDRAAATLARLADPSPRDRFWKAQAARALGHLDEALAELARIPDDDRAAALARLQAGQIERGRGRIHRAATLLGAALALDPTLAAAHRELIYIDGMLLRRGALHQHFLALSRLGPLTFDNVFHWCLTRGVVWEPHERLLDLQRFVAADPDDHAARVALAETLRQVGRRQEAERILLPVPGSDPDARAVRARIALDRGDDRAVATLLDGGPADHAELARLRGRLALARGDAGAAVRHFRAAYAIEPDDRDTAFGLGTALTAIGDEAGAAPYLREAKALDTLAALLTRAANPANRRDLALLRALGAACEAAGRIPEARAWYNLAIGVDPLDAAAQKALGRLRRRETP